MDAFGLAGWPTTFAHERMDGYHQPTQPTYFSRSPSPPHTSKQTTDLISEIEEACDGLHPGDQDGMERADARLRILAPEVTHAVVDGTYLALQESTMAELRHFEEVRPRERCFFDFFFWGRVGLCVAVVFWVAHRQIRFPSKGGV